MRAVLLIAVASVATQLPARDVAPAETWHSADADQCAYEAADDVVPITGERSFRLFSVSRSVI